MLLTDRTYTEETAWEVYAQEAHRHPRLAHERYGPIPLYITENRAAFYDPPTVGAEVHDPLRVDYFRQHLKAAYARSKGVDLRGYLPGPSSTTSRWSLGYSKRFGIVHVDYKTQVRTPKRTRRGSTAG